MYFDFRLLLLALLAFSTLGFASTTIYAPAVDSNGNGVITPIVITATQGTGKIRADIKSSLIATETEESIRSAATAASGLSGISLHNIDINVDIESRAEIIDGPSGGVALAVAIYNEIRHLVEPNYKQIRTDMTITGSITPDGRSGKVGGVEEKLIGANKTGLKLMIIAAGQSALDSLDYAVYAREISNGSLQVVEVADLSGALEYAYTPTGSKVNAQEFIIKPLVLSPFPASQQSEFFKTIALEEIENARLELSKMEEKTKSENGLDDDQIIAVIRSVNSTLKNAQAAVDKGYYYTAANAAFLAKINLQTANGQEEITPSTFQVILNQLESQLSTFNHTVTITDANLQEAAAAQMRYRWASAKFNEVKEEFSTTNAVSITTLRDYFTARAWFDAAKKLVPHSQSIATGEAINEYNLREYALDLLDQSNEIANKSTDNEIQWHFKTAKLALSNAEYLAAIFDFQFILSADNTDKLVTNKTPAQIVSTATALPFDNIYLDSPWAELYYSNALYNLQDANRTQELGSYITAIRLSQLASFFEQAKQTVKTELTNPRPPKNHTATLLIEPPLDTPNVTATITTTTGQNTGALQTIAIIVIIAGVAILGWTLLGKLKPTQHLTNKKELIDKLDEALLTGRISESTYNHLKGKYKTQLRSKSQKKPTSAKSRLQKRR